jgi:hypothetical protein
MSWRNIFLRDVLVDYLKKKGHVFVVIEQQAPLLEKVVNLEEWRARRQREQENLLQLVMTNPEIPGFIYDLLDFIAVDRKNFKIKLSEGADVSEVMTWEDWRRSEYLTSLKKAKGKLGIGDAEFKKVIRLFFLAASELFLEDRNKNGKIFYAFPKEDSDNLYYLSSTQAELNELYDGLKSDNSVFVESWLKLLN